MAKEYIVEKFATGMHYIQLDKATVTKFIKNESKRVICILNESEELHAAIMSKKEGWHFINIGLKTCRKLNLKKGSMVKASFKEDKTEYQFEMPEELEEVLGTDDQAFEKFKSLTPGNQRGLIYLIAQVKSTEKKIERALKIAEQLKRGIHSPREILK